MTDQGTSFEKFGLKFETDGSITAPDGNSINYSGGPFFGAPLGRAAVSRLDPNDPLILQVEHEGLAVVFENGEWKTHLHIQELPDIEEAEEVEEHELPEATDYVYETLAPTNVMAPCGIWLKVGANYIPRDGPVDFYDPILGLQLTRRGQTLNETLRTSDGSRTWRTYTTPRSWKVLFGEPWARTLIFHPVYVPLRLTPWERLIRRLDSTTTKAVLGWTLFVPCLFYFPAFFLYLVMLCQWHPRTIPAWARPTDVLDD